MGAWRRDDPALDLDGDPAGSAPGPDAGICHHRGRQHDGVFVTPGPNPALDVESGGLPDCGGVHSRPGHRRNHPRGRGNDDLTTEDKDFHRGERREKKKRRKVLELVGEKC